MHNVGLCKYIYSLFQSCEVTTVFQKEVYIWREVGSMGFSPKGTSIAKPRPMQALVQHQKLVNILIKTQGSES